VKQFKTVAFDRTVASKELSDFKNLLDSKQWLSETDDVQKLFKPRDQLSALVGFYNTYITFPDMVGNELVLQGDYRCDLVIGQRSTQSFCFVEFEDAEEFSIFEKSDRAHRPFSRRYEHGFSQLVDWCYKISDMRKTIDCEDIFECREPHFVGLLVMGRSSTLSKPETRRFSWRGKYMTVAGHPIFSVTFDELYKHVYERMNLH
jgi:hypothetical protein